MPVNQSDGPLAEGCEPTRLISMLYSFINCAGSSAAPSAGSPRDRFPVTIEYEYDTPQGSARPLS